MGIALSQATLRLLDGPNYAVLATINRDGSPHSSAMWVGRDGDDLVFSTLEGRVKHRNMLRDPRVSVTVIDSADPENYVELRGRVSMTPGHRALTGYLAMETVEVRRSKGPGRGLARGRPGSRAHGRGEGRRVRSARRTRPIASGTTPRGLLEARTGFYSQS